MGKVRSTLSLCLRGEGLIVGLFALLLIYYGTSSFFFQTVIRSDVVGPAFFPRLIAATGLILCAVYFFERYRKVQESSGSSGAREAAGAASERSGGPAESIGAHLVPLALLFAYAITFEPLGFPLSTFLYITLTMRYLGQGWVLSAVAGLTMMVLIFSLFYLGLMADIPLGKFIPSDEVVPYLRELQRMIHG